MIIEKRQFGRTGHMSSAVLFGGSALGHVDQDTADRVLDLLWEYEINHIDTSASYGHSEKRIGQWMKKYRKHFFLASKTGERSYEGAKNQIHKSLERLCTDKIDLIQLHALIHPDEWEQVFSVGGALEATIEARDQGLVQYIGVTGHGWNVAAMHKRSLKRFDFDSVLMPWNYFASKHKIYANDFNETLKICIKKNIAVQTIKSIARGPWSAGTNKKYNTWYEPLDKEGDIQLSVNWLLSHKNLFLNSVGDINLLPTLFQSVKNYRKKPKEAEMNGLVERKDLSSFFVSNIYLFKLFYN